MAKVFVLLNNIKKDEIIKTLESNKFEIINAQGEIEDYFTQINNELPDMVLIDSEFENSKYIIRHIKSQISNIQIILLLNNTNDSELMNLADVLMQCPLNYDILLSTLKTRIEAKKSLDVLSSNNKELSKSLYQLNVLYNTSSQFAGTLNTQKLYDIMLEAMEKTLSFDISSLLVFNSARKPVYLMNSMHTPSEALIQALKIRSVLNYDSIQKESNNTSYDFHFEEIEMHTTTKQTRSNTIFGIEAISFDSLSVPIKVGEDFFGIIELFRKKPFSDEDKSCFYSIAHQVALPLRSAKLYEEISITNKKLEKLEKLKSEFVSIVSHELRTPLTPINNSLEIVLSGQAGPITDETQNFVSMAKRNIQRLSGIIEDLLDLSRIQTGKLDFRYKNVNIMPSLELLSKTFLQVANDKNIQLKLSINEKLPEIYADVRRIEQIISNLVSNSLKFTPENGQIKISTSIVEAQDINQEYLISPKTQPCGRYIKISVQDTGVGIDKEDIPKIFDKFSQIESSLKRNQGGVGLGLTITKQLIDSHLGLIEVISKPKEGSCFSVYLPCLDEFKVFIMDLSKTLINNETGVLKISAKQNGINIVNDLKQNKIINLSKNSKEIILDNTAYFNYLTYISDVSFGSMEAIYNTIKDFCSNKDYNDCDIMINRAHSFKYGNDAIALINELE